MNSARKYLDFAAVSPALENAAAVTARALDFPVALVNILDDSSQYTLVGFGVEGQRGSVVPRSQSACTTVVEIGRPLVVADAARFGAATLESALHTAAPGEDLIGLLLDAGFRSYAAVPLFGRESIPIGTLCVLDFGPRDVSPEQMRLLEQLGVMVEEHLDSQRAKPRVPSSTADVAAVSAAVDAGEITPWYEPIVDLRTGRVHGLEALARWQHPMRGVLGPDVFIAALEATDLIVDLDLRILTTACMNFVPWIVDRPDLTLSVNVSGHHLERPDCVHRIVTAVATAGLSAGSVVLEITETARGRAVLDEARMVAALRAAGFTVVLDDLGSGWSPVPRLTHVGIDGFKLDRSVAASLHTKVGDAVAHAMLQFATELGHSVVLEGLETAARLDAACRRGFTLGQGHYFSEAVPAHQVTKMIDAVEQLMQGHLESPMHPTACD